MPPIPSPPAAVRASLAAIRSGTKCINAFTAVAAESELMDAARAAERRISDGKPLSGIDGRTIAIKDNISTLAPLPTTCSSAMLDGYVAPIEATVVKRLREAGGIVVGKTNMDEFGMGSHSLHTPHGAIPNPLSLSLSVGGSSGGSASSVSSGTVWASLGTDTGGSIRLPASYTSLVGLKPSYGLLSRWGVVAYANSLDTVGLLTSTVSDARDLFTLLSAPDSLDPTCATAATRARAAEVSDATTYKDLSGLKIGVPLEYNLLELSPSVRVAWLCTLQSLSTLGCSILPVSLPSTRHALGAYYVLAPAEASSNLARFDGVRYGFRQPSSSSSSSDQPEEVLFSHTRGHSFGSEVRCRILTGAFTLSAGHMGNYFLRAQSVRRLVRDDFDRVFRARNVLTKTDADVESGEDNGMKVDFLIAPTALGLPPRIDQVREMKPVEAYAGDVLTVPASLAGVPSVSVPVALEEGVGVGVGTVGMQVIGQWGMEEGVLKFAEVIEGLREGR